MFVQKMRTYKVDEINTRLDNGEIISGFSTKSDARFKSGQK